MADERPVGGESEGQTFLIGQNLYLRGIAEKDAQTVAAWHPNPFPLPPDIALDRLRKEVPKAKERDEHCLIACRRDNDRPVGSVTYHAPGWHRAWVTLHANPALSSERQVAIKAELAGLIVPYLVMERDLMAVELLVDGSEPALEAAAAKPTGCARHC
jgi:hypothetical protein